MIYQMELLDMLDYLMLKINENTKNSPRDITNFSRFITGDGTQGYILTNLLDYENIQRSKVQ